MNGYAEYQQLLNSSIQDAQAKDFEKQSAYEGLLNKAEQVRGAIDKATEGVGDLFLVKPAEQLLQTIKGKAEQSILDYTRKHFTKVSRQQGETASENDVSPDVQAQRALGQSPQEGAYEEEGQQMRTYFNDNTQLETSFGRNINTTDEDTAQMLMERGREQVGGAELTGEQQATPATQAQEGSAAQTTTESSSAATDAGSAGADVGDVAGQTATQIGEKLGVGEGLEIGADAGLLADPLTFLFGLILGVGTIVGGIEGGKSAVKNPAVPKPTAIANVSTQFGIGAN
jgi:hypothetical protein